MKINYQQLVMNPMSPVLEKLSRERMPLPEAYKLMKMHRVIKEEVAIAMELFEKIGLEFAEKNEKGMIQKLPNGFHKVEESKQQAYEDAVQAFMKTEVEINRPAIDVEAVCRSASGNFSVMDLEAIHPLTVEATVSTEPSIA